MMGKFIIHHLSFIIYYTWSFFSKNLKIRKTKAATITNDMSAGRALKKKMTAKMPTMIKNKVPFLPLSIF